jgi:hypothetical protein
LRCGFASGDRGFGSSSTLTVGELGAHSPRLVTPCQPSALGWISGGDMVPGDKDAVGSIANIDQRDRSVRLNFHDFECGFNVFAYGGGGGVQGKPIAIIQLYLLDLDNA